MFMIPRGEFAPKRGRPAKYPIGYLRMGESMFFPGVNAHDLRNTFRLHQAMEFKRETAKVGGVWGLRVTRVAERDPDRLRGPIPKYPLRKMEIGESFFAAGQTPNSMHDRWKWMRPRKFKSRSVVKAGVKGVRVWRIA